MAMHINEGVARQREATRDRVKFLLDYHWAGSQRQMARDVGVSQGLISKIVNGQQGAGSHFLAALARQQGVNAEWLLRGEGPPLSLPPKGARPISLGILPGSPLDHVQLLVGQHHPVAETLDRESRYWLELQSSLPLLRDVNLRLLPGDMLLMETDPAWTARLDFVEGRICGVRLYAGTPESTFVLGKVYRDSLGLVFDAVDWVIRQAGTALPMSPAPSVAPTPKASATPRTRPFRRKIRMLDDEEKKASGRFKADEQLSRQPLGDQPDTFNLQDIVGVCVYLARPSPKVVLAMAHG